VYTEILANVFCFVGEIKNTARQGIVKLRLAHRNYSLSCSIFNFTDKTKNIRQNLRIHATCELLQLHPADR